MGQISQTRREEIWCALSDFFAAGDINYWKIADIDIKRLKEIFFGEVALYRAGNQTSAASYGEWVIKYLRMEMEKRKNSITSMLFQKAKSLYCRWLFRDEWKKLIKGLEEYKRTDYAI